MNAIASSALVYFWLVFSYCHVWSYIWTGSHLIGQQLGTSGFKEGAATAVEKQSQEEPSHRERRRYGSQMSEASRSVLSNESSCHSINLLNQHDTYVQTTLIFTNSIFYPPTVLTGCRTILTVNNQFPSKHLPRIALFFVMYECTFV
jgi:hypothetical protein